MNVKRESRDVLPSIVDICQEACVIIRLRRLRYLEEFEGKKR